MEFTWEPLSGCSSIFECQKKLINENHPQHVETIDRKLQATPDVVLAAAAMQSHHFC